MSWNVGFTKPVRREEAEAAIDALQFPGDENPRMKETSAGMVQFAAAKKAAKKLVASLPGPYVSVAMSGHANATGWNKKEGYANDMISVNVSQLCEEDMKLYQS